MKHDNDEKKPFDKTTPYKKKGIWAFVIVNLSTLMMVTLVLFAYNLYGGWHSESFVIKKHNVEGDVLYVFENKSSENGDPSFKNPNEEKLEDTMEVIVEIDGKEQSVRFTDLKLVPDDVQDLVLELYALDEEGKANGIVHVPSEDVMYE